jgi:hypothetical protein
MSDRGRKSRENALEETYDDLVSALAPRTTFFTTQALTRAMAQLSECALQGTLATPEQQLRRWCGQWVALRRLECGMDDAVCIDVGVSADAVVLLEVGLGDPTLASTDAWERLGAALARSSADQPFACAVVSVGLGVQEATPALRARLARELAARYMAAPPGVSIGPELLVRLREAER